MQRYNVKPYFARGDLLNIHKCRGAGVRKLQAHGVRRARHSVAAQCGKRDDTNRHKNSALSLVFAPAGDVFLFAWLSSGSFQSPEVMLVGPLRGPHSRAKHHAWHALRTQIHLCWCSPPAGDESNSVAYPPAPFGNRRLCLLASFGDLVVAHYKSVFLYRRCIPEGGELCIT